VQFEQATIKVQQEKEFQQLKGLIELAFQPANVRTFLGLLRSQGIRVRDFDALLETGIFDRVDRSSGREQSAQACYGKLALSDQAQIKEFYLFRVEDVDPELRAKFHKLYQYY
jgi:hypothetical protein